MKTKFQRLIFLAAMFLIAPFHFSEVASSDPPPAILGLDEDYNTTTYLENGVVWARKIWQSSGEKPMVYSTYTLINLNSEIIFSPF